MSKPENTRYALAEGCSGDLNEFSNRWRGLHTTINSFDQVQTLKELDFVKGAMRALPDNDALLSPIKANNLARPVFTTLNETLTYLHDTVTEANRDVGRCCESIGLAGVKRKPDEDSGLQENNPVDTLDKSANDTSAEILKILKTLQGQVPNKQECRRYLKTGICSWEKDHERPCRFLHLGKNSKIEGVITKTQKESKKAKVVNSE